MVPFYNSNKKMQKLFSSTCRSDKANQPMKQQQQQLALLNVRRRKSSHISHTNRGVKKRFEVMEKKMRRGGDAGVVMIMMKMIMVVLICAVSVLLVMTTMIPCVDAAAFKKPDMYRVGDSDKGWRPDFDYMVWASKHDFYVGDWLYFGYNRTLYNVLEVNPTDYEACRSDNPVANITHGAGRDVFNLTSAKTFYFLSGGGYCFRGMRLAVTAKEYSSAIIPPAAAPSPPKNVTPSDTTRNVVSTVMGSIVVACALVLNV